MGIRTRTLLIVLAPGWALPCTGHAQNPTDLIDSIMAAYGGREALAQVTSYEMLGTMASRTRGVQAPAARTFERPSRLRVVLHYPQRVEVRIVDGDQGWRGDQNGLRDASGPMLAAMRLQAARAALPWILDERRAEVRTIAPLDMKGNVYAGLELPLQDGVTLRVYVDPATGYIVKSEGLLAVEGMHTSFETMFAKFQAVDGVVFAFWEENFASGTHTGSTTFGTVVVNPDLDEGTFGPRGRRD